jgi:hypothetical protein
MFDAFYGVGIALLATGVCGVIWFISGNAWSLYTLEAGRNTAGYLGLTLLARPIVGPRAAAIPAVVASIVAALLGSHADGSARWWAWPIDDARDEVSWLLAFGLLALGAVLLALSRPTLRGE